MWMITILVSFPILIGYYFVLYSEFHLAHYRISFEKDYIKMNGKAFEEEHYLYDLLYICGGLFFLAHYIFLSIFVYSFFLDLEFSHLSVGHLCNQKPLGE